MGLFFWKKKKEEVSYVLDQSMEMPAKQEKAEQPEAAKAPQVAATNEIPPEVIAVIAAAVTVTLGAGARILSVKRAENKRGRAAWSMAGLLENTRPF